MTSLLFIFALISCADVYEYTIVSNVPLFFDFKEGSKVIEVSEKKEPIISSDSDPGKSTPPPSPKRRNSPPRRSNVLDDTNPSAWSRVFNVFVPGSSTNRAFNEVSYDTDSFWYGDD